nr:carboxypeptidase-like regulatory domain-containing protein [uncultured Flavobacterium sp.]
MKIIFLLLFVNISTLVAQNLTGKVLDAKTKEPIAYLVIQVDESEKYQITNESGEFSFNLSDVNNKTLIFENTYYLTKKIQVQNSDNLLVELEPNSVTLEEIIIASKPYSQVFDDIFNAKSNTIDKQIKLETYYIESVFDNENIIKTADGLVDFYILDKKKNFVNSKINESRIRVIQDKTDEELQAISLEASPSKIVEASIQMSQVKDLGKNKKYEFHTTAFKVGNKQMHSLYFYPKQNATDDLMLTGKIIFDAESKKIEEISYELVKEKSKYAQKYKSVLLIAKLKINDIKISAKYTIINGFNVVNFSNYHVNMEIKMFGKNAYFNNTLKMFTHKMDILETKNYEKDYFQNVSLFKFGNHNHSNFWEKEPFKNWELKF